MDFKFENRQVLEMCIKLQLKAIPLLSFIFSEKINTKIIFVETENNKYALLGLYYLKNNFNFFSLDDYTYKTFINYLITYENKINCSSFKTLLSYLILIEDKDFSDSKRYEGFLINGKFMFKCEQNVYHVIDNNIDAYLTNSDLKFDKFITLHDLQDNKATPYLLTFLELSDSLNNISLLNRAILTYDEKGISFCCKETFIKQNVIYFVYIDMIIDELFYKTISGKSSIKNPLQLAEYIVNVSGNKFGNDAETSETYSFSVLIPVKNIILEKEICIGFVRFFNDKYDCDVKKFKEIMEIENDDIVFAVTTVNSNTLYSAYLKAKTHILIAFDLLLSILRSDYIYNISTNSKDCFNRDLLFPNPKIIDWVYVKNNETNEFIILDIDNMDTRTTLNISENEIVKFEKINQIEYIYLKRIYIDKIVNPNKKKSKQINGLKNTFNSLNWINKSWNTLYPDDKVIYSIIAVEFLVSGVSVAPKLDNRIFRKIKSEINKNLEFLISNKETEFEEIDFKDKNKEQFDCMIKFKESIDNLYNKSKDASFMQKMEYLINTCKIPVSKTEMDLIKRARDIRNAIVHGRGNDCLSNVELKQLNNVITKIAHYKILFWKWEI